MRKPIGIALAFALSAAAAASARAVDLTGTWEGAYSCKGFGGVPMKAGEKDSVLLISQAGAVLDASIDGGAGGLYHGTTVDATAKPAEQGEVAMSSCAANPLPLAGDHTELVRLKAKVDPESGRGTLTGISILETEGMLLTCKLKYKRVSAEVAVFETCPTI